MSDDQEYRAGQNTDMMSEEKLYSLGFLVWKMGLIYIKSYSENLKEQYLGEIKGPTTCAQ
jgi:hypothetical protein